MIGSVTGEGVAEVQNKPYYIKHLETHKTCIQFTCTICNTLFQSRSIFNRHSKQHYIDHVSLVRQLVFELVDSVVPVKCNNDCPHCIILKNTDFMIYILMKERDELLKHVKN